MTISQHLKRRLLIFGALSGPGYLALFWAVLALCANPLSHRQWAIGGLALGLALWMMFGSKPRCPSCKSRLGVLVAYWSLKKGHCPYCGLHLDEPYSQYCWSEMADPIRARYPLRR